MISPLDVNEGDRCNEPINEDVQRSIIENIYNVTECKEVYVNMTIDGKLSWRSIYSYEMNSKYVMT
jgi:hypothetical protein